MSSSPDSGRQRRPPSSMRALVLGLLLALTGAQAQEALRPEIGKPLLAAQELIKAQRYKEALGKVRAADAVGARNANESFMIERMRIAAASGAGDLEAAARSFETLSGSSRLAAGEKLSMIESIAGGYYRARDYAKSAQWSQRYLREGGTSSAMRTLLTQSEYLSGDFAGAVKDLTAEVRAAERAGAAPGEDRLKLLLNAASKANDDRAYGLALEKLVAHYPKKEYWVGLLSRLRAKPTFSDRLALDIDRLALATGSMTAASEYMEMAQLALQADFVSEAKQVLDQGYASGALGVGAQADRHKRLRELVARRIAERGQTLAAEERQALAAKDGNALVDVGLRRVFDGEAAKGLALMRQGIAKGGLQRPDDAKLHLGVAYFIAGDGAKGQAAFKSVSASAGSADLARLWALHARRRN